MTTKPLYVLALGLVMLAVPVARPAEAQQTAGPEGVARVDTYQIAATVETVDPDTRQVLLRGPEGGLVTVQVNPNVRNLRELNPGDRVVVRYTEALAARLARADESGSSAAIAAGPILSATGQPTGVVVGDQIRTVVTVQATDPARNTVTVVGSRGVPRTVVVQEPEAQAFARTLQPGDRVDLTYREALAVSVEHAQH